MAWQLLKTTDLPLGKRNLRFGDFGNDVRELQELLKKSGFYFGQCDGWYGVLTEEAVVLFEKTFQLRVDGCAGREVLKALQDSARRTGRIIYTVKPQETLKAISQVFQVHPDAWGTIAGQGNPQRSLYPGMKLLLNEKALLLWEKPGVKTDDFQHTARIGRECRFGSDAEWSLPETSEPGAYPVVTGETADWDRLLVERKRWEIWAKPLRNLSKSRWGMDLRHAPLEAVFQWVQLVKFLKRNHLAPQFLILPLPTVKRSGFPEKIFWLNLPLLVREVGWVGLEPQLDWADSVAYQSSGIQAEQSLRRILQMGLNGKVLWVGNGLAWDWTGEGQTPERIPFREVRLLQAMNHRNSAVRVGAGLSQLNYLKRRAPHTLIFRDEQDWLHLMKLPIKYQLLGLVLRDYAQLGKIGNDLIAASFAVLPESKL